MPEGNGHQPHYFDGQEFHRDVRRVYFGEYNWALNKKRNKMAHVVYEGVHDNPRLPADRRGRGKDTARWICSEEPGCEENQLHGGLELMIDAKLEPNASIGLHPHHHTEEIYYILEGAIAITTVGDDGQEHTEELSAGDAHFVRLGQSHYGKAGPKGCRFIAVAVRA